MSRILRVSLIALVLLTAASAALACGDKLLVLGRGVRYRLFAGRPTAVLAYAPAGDTTAGWLTQPQVRRKFEDAGYKLVVAENSEQFMRALRADRFELVIADLAHAEEINRQIDPAISGMPLFVPLIASAPDRALTRQYCCVLRAGSKPGSALDILDKAVEAKVRRDRAKVHGD